MRTTQKVALALREVGAEGVNIGINNEPVAGQVVFHFHVHVIPRFSSDGLNHWSSKEVSQDESIEIASKLREKLS
jgi:diadenosine tetraphosphate (Ap4A) HIT family hydrolase